MATVVKVTLQDYRALVAENASQRSTIDTLRAQLAEYKALTLDGDLPIEEATGAEVSTPEVKP